MERDELAVGLRDRGDLRADAGVERVEAGLVGGGLAVVVGGVGRVDLRERGRDPVDVQLAVLDVHPQVRVLRARVLAGQELDAGQVDAQLEQRRAGRATRW